MMGIDFYSNCPECGTLGVPNGSMLTCPKFGCKSVWSPAEEAANKGNPSCERIEFHEDPPNTPACSCCNKPATCVIKFQQDSGFALVVRLCRYCRGILKQKMTHVPGVP